MQLLLFDIDGTLTHSGGAGSRAIYLALEQMYGMVRYPKPVSMAGKTDVAIFRELLRINHLQERPGDLAELYRVYPRMLRRCLREVGDKAHPHPSVAELLRKLVRLPEFTLGLLTGNLAETARIKLARFRLNHYFKLGAYGSDNADRMKLPAIARRRAKEMGLRVGPRRMVVIGDTPRDIACAKGYGVRSVAVATGPYSVRQLKRHKPDLVYKDLSDTDGFIRQVRLLLVAGRSAS